MATVYSGKRYNSDSSCWWRIRADYSGTSATAYADVGPSGWSIYLRFTTGTNTFQASAKVWYASNNGKDGNKLGSLTISETSSTTITQTCSGSTWGGTVNGESKVTIPAQKAYYNLNILTPADGEPADGTAGTVECSINNGSYSRIGNEAANYYAIGTTFAYRNFSAPTGTHLSGVTGASGSGPWSLTLNSSTTVTFSTDWNTYTIKYNANGGSGSMSNTGATYNSNVTLRSNSFTRTGYTFAGWATSSSGSVVYGDGASVKNLTSTNGGSVTLYAKWNINSYYLDLNAYLDGTYTGGLGAYGTADVTVNGTKVGNDITDYYSQHNYGSSYSVSDIRANSGYQYNGVSSGSLSGTIGTSNVSVVLNFSTKKPWDVGITGTVTGPFGVDLSWSAAGLNISNYTVYANGTRIYNGTGTSYSFAAAEETTYNFYVVATNVGGSTTSSTVTYTTPADQAKIRIKGKKLPDTLQKVEYIQTDGAQLINLGKVGDSVSQYDIQFIADNHRQLMGYGGSGSEYWGATDSTMYEAGGTRGPSTDTTQRRNIIWTYNYRDGVTKVEYDGSTITNTPSKNVDDIDYKLFNISADASAQYGCACRLYGLTIYHYDNKVHELIPCYRKSDGVIGLYDAAGGKFYTNEGTGSFTKGPDTQIGDGWLKGKTYLKKDGAWFKAKKLYVKVNGQWKIASNYES